MKKLALTYFAVKRISNSVPATEFNRTDLETAARTSLELGGFVQPPVLRRTGKMTDMTYTVVSGHGQYHAACIAREWDWENGETIGCIIIEPETEAAITLANGNYSMPHADRYRSTRPNRYTRPSNRSARPDRYKNTIGTRKSFFITPPITHLWPAQAISQGEGSYPERRQTQKNYIY